MPRLIIGAPIFKRAWIIDKWFEYIENQTFPLSEMGFVFELGEDDDETHEKMWEWHSRHPEVSIFDGVVRGDIKHSTHPPKGRFWPKSSYWKMVEMRNALLERVRMHAPERYYSLDSDILLEDPETIQKLYDLTEEYDGVGTLSYMTARGTQHPSVMTWRDKPGGPAYRRNDYPIGETFEADVIMASKMMSKNCYLKSRYIWHKQGEDLGWSAVCAERKLKLACASNIYTAHVMHDHLLDDYLENGDNRSTNKIVEGI